MKSTSLYSTLADTVTPAVSLALLAIGLLFPSISDAAALKVKNCNAAMNYVHRDYRKGWTA